MDVKYKATLFAIISALLLALSKFSIGLTSGSMAVLSSSLDSILDIFMSSMNFLAIREAAKPADVQHQYGHGKAENLAAVLQSLVIIFTGGVILYKSIHMFLHKEAIQYSGLDLGVMILSMIFSVMISTVLRKVAEKTGSSALKADALHYSSDVYSNTAAIAAIVLTFYTKMTFFDLLFSVVVAGILIASASKIFRDGFAGLMDASVSGKIEDRLNEIVSTMQHPYAGYHKVRSRFAGNKKYLDFHLLICRNERIDEAHKMADRLETILLEEITNLDIVIHLEPCDNPCDLTERTCLEWLL